MVFKRYKIVLSYLCFVTLSLGGFLTAGTISNNSTPTPTGYTLDDIYNLTQNISASSHTLAPTRDFSSPTMHSVSEVYVALANLINPASTTITYLGIAPNSSFTPVSTVTKDFTPTTSAGSVTGFTLEDINNLINNNRITIPSHDFSPSSDPSDSGVTLTGIYNSLSTLISSSTVATGTIYLGVRGSYVAPDITPPTITDFIVPATSTSLTIDITTFIAADDVGVIGYLVNESPSTPALDDPNWTDVATTTYTFASAGTSTLYVWAKDAAGNVSTSASQGVVITLPLTWSTDVANDVNWYAANTFCSDLVSAGYDDWRAPTMAELDIAYGSGNNPFGVFPPSVIWSSETASPSVFAWYFNSRNGATHHATQNKGVIPATGFAVRCVR